MKTTRLEVTGMSCPHCERAVEDALRGTAGVRGAAVSLEDGAAEVEYDETATGPERLVAAVEEEGYGAKVAGSA